MTRSISQVADVHTCGVATGEWVFLSDTVLCRRQSARITAAWWMIPSKIPKQAATLDVLSCSLCNPVDSELSKKLAAGWAHYKIKGEVLYLRTTLKNRIVRGGKAPRFPDLAAKWSWVFSFTFFRPYSREQISWYPVDKISVSLSSNGEERICTSSENRTPIV
jgi:hypothetical protein